MANEGMKPLTAPIRARPRQCRLTFSGSASVVCVGVRATAGHKWLISGRHQRLCPKLMLTPAITDDAVS